MFASYPTDLDKIGIGLSTFRKSFNFSDEMSDNDQLVSHLEYHFRIQRECNRNTRFPFENFFSVEFSTKVLNLQNICHLEKWTSSLNKGVRGFRHFISVYSSFFEYEDYLKHWSVFMNLFDFRCFSDFFSFKILHFRVRVLISLFRFDAIAVTRQWVHCFLNFEWAIKALVSIHSICLFFFSLKNTWEWRCRMGEKTFKFQLWPKLMVLSLYLQSN